MIRVFAVSCLVSVQACSGTASDSLLDLGTTGRPTAASLSVTPTEVRFISVPMGHASFREVVVTNLGAAAINISGWQLSGSSSFSLVGAEAGVIDTGMSVSATVVFAPESPAVAEGAVTIQGAEPPYERWVVPLVAQADARVETGVDGGPQDDGGSTSMAPNGGDVMGGDASAPVAGDQSPDTHGILFTEVGEQIGFADHRFRARSLHALGINWIDYDNDGLDDLLAVNGDVFDARLYHNDGDGTFSNADIWLPTFPDVEMSESIYADYDNDGDLDVYIVNDFFRFTSTEPTGPINMLLRNMWIESGHGYPSSGPLFVDVTATAGVADEAPPGLGAFPGKRGKAACWIDYDRDGCIDLYVGNLVLNQPGTIGNRDVFYRNNCDGTFSDVTGAVGLTPGNEAGDYRPTLVLTCGHMDGDLWPDIYVGHITITDAAWAADVYFRNNGDGTFADVTAMSPGLGGDTQADMGTDLADIDLDGDWDLYISDISNSPYDNPPAGNALYLGDGGGNLSVNLAVDRGVDAHDSWGVNFFDADNDGDDDLYVATIYQKPYMYVNDGTATFHEVGDWVGLNEENERGSATSDYDGDGDLDLAVIAQGKPVRIYRNDSVTLGSWLKVRPIATTSNRAAIGTLVEVDSGGVTRRRQVKGGTSAHSQESAVLHFGMPSTAIVDEIRVFWPSGAVSTVSQVATGQLLSITEP